MNDKTRDGENPMTELVTGYRKLSDSELRMVNEIKHIANTTIDPLLRSLDGPVVGSDGAFFPDPRLLSVARTQFEIAFAMLIKSVAKPTTTF